MSNLSVVQSTSQDLDILITLNNQIETTLNDFIDFNKRNLINSKILNTSNEVNLEPCQLNINRIKYENINPEDCKEFDSFTEEYIKKLEASFNDISNSLDILEKNDLYKKSLPEIMSELKDLKQINNNETENLKMLVNLSNDILNNIELSNSYKNMFS